MCIDLLLQGVGLATSMYEGFECSYRSFSRAYERDVWSNSPIHDFMATAYWYDSCLVSVTYVRQSLYSHYRSFRMGREHSHHSSLYVHTSLSYLILSETYAYAYDVHVLQHKVRLLSGCAAACALNKYVFHSIRLFSSRFTY